MPTEPPPNKRKRLGVASLLCLALLTVFLLTQRFSDLASNPAFSFLFKLTTAVSVLWLAWPDLVKLRNRLPPRFLLLAPIALVALLIQPRLGAFLVALTFTYWMGWIVYRKVFFGDTRRR